MQSQMSNAVPGVPTLPSTSRHRPDAELTRGAVTAGIDAAHVGAVAGNMDSDAITHTAAAAGKRGPRATGLRSATDESCILLLEYVRKGTESAVSVREETLGAAATGMAGGARAFLLALPPVRSGEGAIRMRSW
ncbi:hypothetical protein SVIO_004910 [Streptomyces violaceusniger]|uniref:Uncharacterized protein n=1 Tax=Streptomyces violaceusniger TaxID=68280 RepID=A0A4D4KTZ9_STRVO|nr:hypothetical protein SVIO_004910 [Streptomyces violaceusniger]